MTPKMFSTEKKILFRKAVVILYRQKHFSLQPRKFLVCFNKPNHVSIICLSLIQPAVFVDSGEK